MSSPLLRPHGGPGAAGPAAFDFSTNANAAGPCPEALAAVRAADAVRYPDPAYTALRARLAARHGVAEARIVPAASGSEAIFRLTARAAQRGLRQVRLPEHAYGDYAQAARAWGLQLVSMCMVDAADEVCGKGEAEEAGEDMLAWQCDPSSPLGRADPPRGAGRGAPGIRALDRAYAPLRLSGADPWAGAAADAVWQLWTPNKALGLTGVRAAYLIAPADGQDEAAALDRLAPSWAIGAHGVALLEAWCTPQVADWLAGSLPVLRRWTDDLQALCADLGWAVLPGDTPFFCARPPVADLPALLHHLRGAGVQLRDCASFGLPGHVRLAAQPPAAQAAFGAAVRRAPSSLFSGDPCVPA